MIFLKHQQKVQLNGIPITLEASAEIIEILKYVSKEDVRKIPIKLIKFFEKIASPNYNVKINPNKSLYEQNIKEKTKDIITIIYRNYWCNEEERKALDSQLIENDSKYEETLRKKYDPNDLFKRDIQSPIFQEKENNNQEAIVKYKESIIKRIINKIKRFLGK